MKSSLESFALATLNQRFGGQVRRKGWGPELSRQERLSDYFQGEAEEWRRIFPYRPDGFAKFAARGLVWLVAFEIEDTNPLPRHKLNAYAELWFSLDCTTTHELLLVLTDRYGRPSYLSLMDVWYAIQFEHDGAGRGGGMPPEDGDAVLGFIADHLRRQRHRGVADPRRERRLWNRKMRRESAAEAVEATA